MEFLTKISVFIHRYNGGPELKEFSINDSNIDQLLDLLNSQDVERLTRLVTESHNQKQEILKLEREISLLKHNLGIKDNKLGQFIHKDVNCKRVDCPICIDIVNKESNGHP